MADIVSSDLSREYAFDVFARSAGFPQGIEGLWAKNLFRLRRFLSFFRQVRHGEYGMAHIHSADPAFLGTTLLMLLARLAGVRILLHMHGTDWEWFYTEAPLLRKLYTRLGLLLPDRILVLYTLWQEKLKDLGIAAEVSVLPNFVHRSGSPDQKAVDEVRQWLNIEEGSFVVVTVGTVGWRKGTFEILKAVPDLVRKDPSFRFVLVGGEEKPREWLKLMEIVKGGRLEAWTRFTGEVARERIAAILALGHVFLLPSFIEGMPIAIIEAMRSGLPIVTTPVNGIPEVIEDRVSGILIDPGDPVAIADAVLLLREDASLRESLSQGARKAFEERFEFAGAMERLRKVYDRVLRADGKPSV
jgi:glycosyltransferase involved in cell wall biosynthesis